MVLLITIMIMINSEHVYCSAVMFPFASLTIIDNGVFTTNRFVRFNDNNLLMSQLNWKVLLLLLSSFAMSMKGF